jgi:hypothetical protein
MKTQGVQDGFVDAIVRAPLGVALLARLESKLGRDDEQDYDPNRCEVAAIERAAELVGSIGLGEFIAMTVLAAVIDVGPWIGDAADTAAACYRHAEARSSIAQAIEDRFGVAFHAPIDRSAQQWWMSEKLTGVGSEPLFVNFEQVYDAGQFTLAGLWTDTDPPGTAHLQLVDAWEMPRGALRRWSLPVQDDARLFEIHRPEDWTLLVAEHPRPASQNLEHWELPSRNQRPDNLADLLAQSGQRAARTRIDRHLVPDWRSVASKYDGVHLSWAGFITSEGCITDMDDGAVTMLRYWFSERSLWLADVFGDAIPAPAPLLDDDWLQNGPAASGSALVEMSTSAGTEALNKLLGR